MRDAVLVDPLLQYQPNMPPPARDGNGQYQQFMGEPVYEYPAQNYQYQAPNQPSPINRPNPLPNHNEGVRYPDF